MKKWFTCEAKSFLNASKGVVRGVTERHIRYHWLASLSVTFTFFILPYSKTEMAILIVCCCLVLGLEYLNTAIEKLADAVHPEHHPLIGSAKNVAAGAVLIASVGALIVGLIIIAPYLFSYFTNQ